MNEAHTIERIEIIGSMMHLVVDGREYTIDIAAQSERLANAAEEQIQRCEISPSGYGIHWPDVVEDLSIDRLIGVSHSLPIEDTTTI